MLIANPIYDVVFKYLLEDIEIARGLLSTILGEEIISLSVKPQETVTESPIMQIGILRFDFKAVIKTKEGDTKKVLIELQKAKQSLDTMRFRRYLGDNYKKEYTITDDNGEDQTLPLPILTIYFLGFDLDKTLNSVVKIEREYIDVITGKRLSIKEDFIELLTHDSFIIQLKRLSKETSTHIEKVLQVFNPEFAIKNNPQQLDFQGDDNEPLVQKMLSRLERAHADEDIRRIMDAEDEIDRAFAREMKKKDVIIAEQDAIIANQERALEAERQKAAALLSELEELRKQIKK
jgi:uncharacterized damage-inducible protein DinB